MYLDHFGMRELPFRLTPDTGYFYKNPSHHEALNVLLVAIRSGEGFVKISGEVGTGKTLLCRLLLNALDEEFVTAYIPNPYLEPEGLHLALAEELGIACEPSAGQHHLLKQINQNLIEHHAAGRSVVLLLDEAQAMPSATLEALRLLSNLETEKSKLLQVVMFGQPELDQRLEDASLRQLKQRIGFSYRLSPLDAAGLEGYVNYRLMVAGYQGPAMLRKDALSALQRCSGGIPRLVNMLMHKALMIAYGRGESRLTRQHLLLAAQDTEGAQMATSTSLHWLGMAVGGLLAAGVGLGVAYWWRVVV